MTYKKINDRWVEKFVQLKVVKFGGSSLADEKQFRKVAAIIQSDPSRRYVVPSAPGKRFSGDTKVTDMLYACYDAASRGCDITDAYGAITKRYDDLIEGLGLDLDLSKEYEAIRNAFINHGGRDYAASRGEYLNGKILAAYIGFDFLDAADVIFFREDGTFDSERTNSHLEQVLREHEHAVIPGFYGSMPYDTIKTFSRGGPDITGSIIARAAGADLYENWTDVSGFLMADPRIVENPREIETITYRELRELSYMGATVLHEDAIFPVRFAGIPINIRNTNDPAAPGTMIVAKADGFDEAHVITGIAGKKGFCVLTVEKPMMNAELGFARRLLSVLERERICFEHLPSGIDTMSVIIDRAELEGRSTHVVEMIREAVEPECIYLEDQLALIAVVGRGMVKAKGTAARVFDAAARAGANIRMIDQGSSELNIILGVDEDDFETTMCAIYDEFVTA